MHKVFLVEDEIFVLQSLKALIKWEEFGFRIVGEALNGLDAYEKIMMAKPDIVFTDIIMPRMNGLELIQKVKKENPEIQFAVISGYAEFDFAHKAFNYGGMGYCLKPFDENEIITVLQKAKDRLDKIKKIREFNLLEIINEKQEKYKEKLIEALADLEFEQHKGKGLIVVVSIGSETLKLPDSVQSLVLKLGLNKNAYILESDSKESIMDNLKENLPPLIKGVGISDVFYNVEMLGERITETTLSAYRFFINEKPGVYDSTGHEQKEMRIIFQNMDEAIEKRELSAIMLSMDRAGDFFSKELCSVKNIFEFFNRIMWFLSRTENNSIYEYSYYYEELFNTFGSMNAMLEYLKKLLEQDLGIKSGNIRDDFKNVTFMKIIKYINENYFYDINLQSIARNYIINPSYISQLFKKKLNTTYTDYITDLRIRLAENLLKTTNLQITEVSEKAGYSDYFYFTKVFKKVIGMTPSEYRKAYNDSC